MELNTLYSEDSLLENNIIFLTFLFTFLLLFKVLLVGNGMIIQVAALTIFVYRKTLNMMCTKQARTTGELISTLPNTKLPVSHHMQTNTIMTFPVLFAEQAIVAAWLWFPPGCLVHLAGPGNIVDTWCQNTTAVRVLQSSSVLIATLILFLAARITKMGRCFIRLKAVAMLVICRALPISMEQSWRVLFVHNSLLEP